MTLILKDKVFTILGGFYLGVEVFLNKKEHQKKRALKLKTEASLYTLYKSFENSIYTLYSYFCQDIIKWCKVYTKTDTWFQKSHAEFKQPQTNSRKSKKLKFDGLLCQKNTFLYLKHIQMIHLTLLSTTCVKIHQIPYVIFETISHFSRHNSSVYF